MKLIDYHTADEYVMDVLNEDIHSDDKDNILDLFLNTKPSYYMDTLDAYRVIKKIAKGYFKS